MIADGLDTMFRGIVVHLDLLADDRASRYQSV